MPRNKIPLCAFIGAQAIIFGIFFLTIGWLIIREESMGRFDLFELAAMAVPIVGGGALLLSGIGLLKRKNWARIVANIILFIFLAIIATALYLFVQEMLNRSYWRNITQQFGVIIFLLSLWTGLFLFLNNTRVMDELKKDKKLEDI